MSNRTEIDGLHEEIAALEAKLAARSKELHGELAAHCKLMQDLVGRIDALQGSVARGLKFDLAVVGYLQRRADMGLSE